MLALVRAVVEVDCDEPVGAVPVLRVVVLAPVVAPVDPDETFGVVKRSVVVIILVLDDAAVVGLPQMWTAKRM